MRSYERNGVLIDQCTECRGIFLDRGELERLVDAENTYNQAPAAQPAPAYGSPEPARYEQPYRGHDERPYQQRHYDDDHRYGKKRKKSFLENLFDD